MGTFIGAYFEMPRLWDTKYVYLPVQHWDSSAYKFSKFVHKIRHM